MGQMAMPITSDGIHNWNQQNLCLGSDEFQLWAGRVEKKTGVVIPDNRRLFLETRLRQRLRETSQTDFDSYFVNQLCGLNAAQEWAALIDLLTVHQTHFFRHPPSINFVAGHIREHIKAQEKEGVPIEYHAWSVGCATGEEAYSLAMVADAELKESRSKSYYSVTGTDVSLPAVSVGREAIYEQDRLREIPALYRRAYCKTDASIFTINEAVKRRVGFAILNLMDIYNAPFQNMNLIYCQNVLIYFSREMRREIAGQLSTMLAPGGLLVFGAGELTNWIGTGLERVDLKRVLAYQRLKDEA